MEPCAGGGKGFDGLSTLRNGDGDAEEDRGGYGGGARRPAAHLEAYLKDTSSLKPVGKRKRRKKNRSTKGNLMIVDAEEGTAIPVATMDSGYGDEDVNDELGPVVVNAEEVERDEALRKRRTIARSNQRWQTVTTAAASTPSAVPAGGSRSRSPSPGTGTGLGGRHDTDTDPDDDDDDGGSDLEVVRRPRVRYDSPDSSDVHVERRGGGSGAKGSDSSDDGGSDSDSDMDVRRRGRASSTSSEGRGGGGRDLNPGPSAGGMTDGTSTGLVSSKALAQELERKRQEKLRKFAEMDPSVSGRAAETVYRDRDTGARVTKSELEQKEESRRQQEREKPMWSAGLAQKRRRVRELRETTGHGEPSSTDGAGLRDRQRFGDPMAHLVKKKAPVAHEEDGETFYQDRFGVSLEELRKGGFVIPAGVPPHSWLKRGVRCPENRFGIRPGAHWDGVDRSNGFERDYFREMNKKKERDRMAFMWSQEDM